MAIDRIGIGGDGDAIVGRKVSLGIDPHGGIPTAGGMDHDQQRHSGRWIGPGLSPAGHRQAAHAKGEQNACSDLEGPSQQVSSGQHVRSYS